MNTLKETSITGLATVLLGGVLPLLQADQLYAAIIASVVGITLLALKYFTREKN